MVPDPSLTIRERAIASWPTAWHGHELRDVLVALGYDVDVPWRDLPKKDRDWILYTDETPFVPVHSRLTLSESKAAIKAGVEPSYSGTIIRGSSVHSGHICEHEERIDEAPASRSSSPPPSARPAMASG